MWRLLRIILIVFILAFLVFRFLWVRKENSQDGVIQAASNRYAVNRALIKALVWKESRFNAEARGKVGERGLMQIREAAAQEWATAERVQNFNPQSLFDPGTNTLAGSWYLRKLLRRYQDTDHPMVFALADYNAGRTHVLRWKKEAGKTNSTIFLQRMDFPGTKNYIIEALDRKKRYEERFKSSWIP